MAPACGRSFAPLREAVFDPQSPSRGLWCRPCAPSNPVGLPAFQKKEKNVRSKLKTSLPAKHNTRLRCLWLLAAPLQFLAAGAQAQASGTGATETALPAIRVQGEREPAAPLAKRSSTATKTDTPLVETPQSISVVTGEEMQARGAANVRDALGYTAGVTGMVSLDTNDDLSLRGFPMDRIKYFLSGLLVPATPFGTANVEPYGMERIEVLKGPSSMLYGQSTSGGLVNAVSKRPPEVSQREVQVGLGSDARKQVAFDVGGPLSPQSEWSYRLTGLERRSRTMVEFVRDDRTFLAPALTWRPSARTSLTLLASTQRDDAGHSGGTQALLPLSGILLPNPNGTVSPGTYGGEPGFDGKKIKQHALGYELAHAFGDTWTLQQRARVDRLKADVHQTVGFFGLDPSDGRTLYRGAFVSDGGDTAASVDTSLQAKWGNGRVEHTSLVGLDVRRERVSELEYWGPAPTIDIFAPVYGAEVTQPSTPYSHQNFLSRQTGLYLQDQMKIDQRWLLTLGLRRDEARTRVDDHLMGVTTRPRERQTSWRAGASYLLGGGVAPYVSAATSFQPNTTPNPFGEPFKAARGRQYELGVKVQPPGSNSLYTAALFDLTQRNTLTADPDQINHPLGRLQVDEFRSRGLELEAKTSLTRSLDLVAAYTYLDAKFTRSQLDNLGNGFWGIPANSGALWLDYKATRALSIGGGVRRMGQRPTSDMNMWRYMQPAFTMVDAAVRYEVDHVALALSLHNLTDKVVTDCGQQCFYSAGRSVLGTLTYRW